VNEVIKMVSDRAGISEEQARKAVEAVADFAKTKFPSMAGQIDSVLKGGGGGGGGGNPLGDVGNKLGGMFGS
jgi:hypothetical protein